MALYSDTEEAVKGGQRQLFILREDGSSTNNHTFLKHMCVFTHKHTRKERNNNKRWNQLECLCFSYSVCITKWHQNPLKTNSANGKVIKLHLLYSSHFVCLRLVRASKTHFSLEEAILWSQSFCLEEAPLQLDCDSLSNSVHGKQKLIIYCQQTNKEQHLPFPFGKTKQNNNPNHWLAALKNQNMRSWRQKSSAS